MLHPFLLIIGYGKSLEEFLSPLEVSLERRGKERLSESSWTIQKDIRHLLLSKIYDIFRLIHVEVIFLTNSLESLHSNRKAIYQFCHNLMHFMFCAAKIQRISETTKQIRSKIYGIA